MADSILFGIAQKIIENIASAAVQEMGSIWGVTKELSRLEETISTIKDVLLDAEEKKNHNHQVSNWLKKLEDVVYEADDLMDDVSTEALQRQLMSGSNMGKKLLRRYLRVSGDYSCAINENVYKIALTSPRLVLFSLIHNHSLLHVPKKTKDHLSTACWEDIFRVSGCCNCAITVCLLMKIPNRAWTTLSCNRELRNVSIFATNSSIIRSLAKNTLKALRIMLG